MDRWIKAIPTNFTQCILSHVHILECMWNVNVDVCDVQMKLVFQLAVPPAKSPVHKAVSLEGENKFIIIIAEKEILFSPVSPFLKTCGANDNKFRYIKEKFNVESRNVLFSNLLSFHKHFSEAARKVGEIAWGRSCFVTERWKQFVSFLPKCFPTDNEYKYEYKYEHKYEAEIWNK